MNDEVRPFLLKQLPYRLSVADKVSSIPYEDFDVNAGGTVNLLVAAGDFCPESPIKRSVTVGRVLFRELPYDGGSAPRLAKKTNGAYHCRFQGHSFLVCTIAARTLSR